MTEQPESSTPDVPPLRPRRRRPSHRERIRERNRREREAAIASRPKPRKDAAVEMFRGSPLEGVIGNPLLDPLFLPAAEFEERKRIQAEVAAYENESMACGFNSHYINFKGDFIPADKFVEWQSRTAYEMLKLGIDVRTVAAKIHRDPPWVESIAQKFNITSIAPF